MNLLIAKEIQTDLSTEPLTTAAAKAAMKISFSDDDALIASLCKNARLWLENYTGLQLGKKTIKLTVDMSPMDLYTLPGPVTGILSVTSEGDCVTYKQYGDSIEVYSPGVHEILYQCGYTTVPDDILNDLKRIVAWSYQNRGIELSNETASLTSFPELASVWYKRVVI
jgi:hypothetical protein